MISQLWNLIPTIGHRHPDGDAVDPGKASQQLLTKSQWRQLRTIIREINDELCHYDYSLRIRNLSRRDLRNETIHIVVRSAGHLRNGRVLGQLVMQPAAKNKMRLGIYKLGETLPEQTLAVLHTNAIRLPEQAMQNYLTVFVNWCLFRRQEFEAKSAPLSH